MKYCNREPNARLRKMRKSYPDYHSGLKGAEFDEHPVLTRRKSLFQSRVNGFASRITGSLLELIAAHSAGPGDSYAFGRNRN